MCGVVEENIRSQGFEKFKSQFDVIFDLQKQTTFGMEF